MAAGRFFFVPWPAQKLCRAGRRPPPKTLEGWPAPPQKNCRGLAGAAHKKLWRAGRRRPQKKLRRTGSSASGGSPSPRLRQPKTPGRAGESQPPHPKNHEPPELRGLIQQIKAGRPGARGSGRGLPQKSEKLKRRAQNFVRGARIAAEFTRFAGKFKRPPKKNPTLFSAWARAKLRRETSGPPGLAGSFQNPDNKRTRLASARCILFPRRKCSEMWIKKKFFLRPKKGFTFRRNGVCCV